MATASPAKRPKIEHDHDGHEAFAEVVEIPSWLFDPDSPQNREVPFDRPLSFSELRRRYVKQCRESECFDVDPLPEGICLMGGISPCPLEFAPELLITMSKRALQEYNSENDGANYEFVEFVKANKQPVAGLMYYLTIRAKDDDTSVIFQAKVWYQVGGIIKVMFCRKKSDKLETRSGACGCGS